MRSVLSRWVERWIREAIPVVGREVIAERAG